MGGPQVWISVNGVRIKAAQEKRRPPGLGVLSQGRRSRKASEEGYIWTRRSVLRSTQAILRPEKKRHLTWRPGSLQLLGEAEVGRGCVSKALTATVRLMDLF